MNPFWPWATGVSDDIEPCEHRKLWLLNAGQHAWSVTPKLAGTATSSSPAERLQ